MRLYIDNLVYVYGSPPTLSALHDQAEELPVVDAISVVCTPAIPQHFVYLIRSEDLTHVLHQIPEDLRRDAAAPLRIEGCEELDQILELRVVSTRSHTEREEAV